MTRTKIGQPRLEDRAAIPLVALEPERDVDRAPASSSVRSRSHAPAERDRARDRSSLRTSLSPSLPDDARRRRDGHAARDEARATDC